VTLIRRPVLYWFVLASAAALAAGGRLSLRLLFDTLVTLAAMPLLQVIAFAAVYWSGRRGLTFSEATDEFFAGSRAWYVAAALVGLFGASVSRAVSAQWFPRVGMAVFLVAIVVSVRVDFRFYRDALARTPRRAAADVVAQRAVAWTATVSYFLWTALPKIATLPHDVWNNLMAARP
jgi:hypothetical protein